MDCPRRTGLPAFGLAGSFGPQKVVSDLWSHHDYTTIAVGTISDALARIALTSGNRERILERTRRILRQNYPILERWVWDQRGLFTFVPPAAGAIAYLRYTLDINSTELMRKLLDEKSVLVVPGDHFGMDRYLRINYGPPPQYLE